MVTAISSQYASAILGTIGDVASFASPDASAANSPFGPDFLLNVLGSSSSASGSAYDASGRPVLPSANSKAGRERSAALDQARQLLKSGDSAGARDVTEQLLAKY